MTLFFYFEFYQILRKSNGSPLNHANKLELHIGPYMECGILHATILETTYQKHISETTRIWWFCKGLGMRSLVSPVSVLQVTVTPTYKSAQRRRRWADVVHMLYKCFVFTGGRQRPRPLTNINLALAQRPTRATSRISDGIAVFWNTLPFLSLLFNNQTK